MVLERKFTNPSKYIVSITSRDRIDGRQEDPKKKYTADLRKVWQSIVQAVSKSPRRVPDKKKRPLALAQGIPALHDELLLGSIQ